MIEIRKLTIEARITSENAGVTQGMLTPARGTHAYFDANQHISEIVQRVVDRLKDNQENS